KAGPVARGAGSHGPWHPDEVGTSDPACVTAGRHAVDVGRVRSEEANACASQRLELVRIGALLGKDRPLVLWTAQRILPDHPVASNDPVARDDQRHGVVAERRPDSPDRPGPADLGCDPAIWPDLAARDLEGLHPDRLLERRRAAQVEVDPDLAVAGEPSLDLPGEIVRQGVMASRNTSRSGEEPRLEFDIVGCPRDLRHTASVPRHAQRAEWRRDDG